MKKNTLLFTMLLFSFVTFSQSIVIGTGSTLTPVGLANPIDSYNESFKYQIVYTATELSASLTPYDEITALGFQVYYDNSVGDLLGYTIKMGHTSETNLASNHDASPTIVVKNPFNYNPVASGTFDMITFDTHFVWNGVDNVIVEICKDINSNAGMYPFGQVVCSNTTIPSIRYYRADGISSCGEDTNSPIVQKPNIQFNYTDGTPPSCLPANTLTANTITATSADIGWTSGGSGESDWEVVIQTAGTGIPTGSGTSTAGANPYSAGSLTPETDYEFYVRADCGTGFSTWAGPFTFTTLCGVYPASYTQNFTTYPSNCWEEGNDTDVATGPNGTDGQWYNNGFLNVGTTGAATFDFYLSGNKDWLVSPAFDFTGGSFGVSVDVGVTPYSGTNAITMGSDDSVTLLISSDNGATWTNLIKWTETNSPSNTGDNHVIDLSSYTSATTKFAFWATDGATITGDYKFYVDNFRVDAYTTLSVDDLQSMEGFKFYPNPVNDVLNVSAKNVIEKLQIVNMLGQVIKTVTPNIKTYQLDFSELSTGIYFVKASVKNTEGAFRIVKKQL